MNLQEIIKKIKVQRFLIKNCNFKEVQGISKL